MKLVDNFGEYIIHTKKGGGKTKKYKASCDKCDKDRGYQMKAKFFKLCWKCTVETPEYKKKLSTAIKAARSTPESRAKTVAQLDRQWAKQRVDPNHILSNRIKSNLRSRLNAAVKKLAKLDKLVSAVTDLGCSLKELKQHLENQFTEGMSWGNYGRIKGIKCWEIDHIMPLSAFDLLNDEELKKAINYKNLQPLWVSENRKKGSKYFTAHL